MKAAADISARKRLGVATEAGVERFLGSDFGEGDNRRLAASSFDVGLPGSVAAFAAGIFRSFLAAGDAFVMGIAEELVPNSRVTSLAGFAADIIGAAAHSGQEKSGLGHPKERHYLI
jgi:hypothetical protein